MFYFALRSTLRIQCTDPFYWSFLWADLHVKCCWCTEIGSADTDKAWHTQTFSNFFFSPNQFLMSTSGLLLTNAFGGAIQTSYSNNLKTQISLLWLLILWFKVILTFYKRHPWGTRIHVWGPGCLPTRCFSTIKQELCHTSHLITGFFKGLGLNKCTQPMTHCEGPIWQITPAVTLKGNVGRLLFGREEILPGPLTVFSWPSCLMNSWSQYGWQ